MDILSYLLTALKLLAEILIYVETSPSWWFDHGYSLGPVLIISYVTYTLRVAADAAALRLGFGLVEVVLHKVISWLPHSWHSPVKNAVRQGDGGRQRLLLKLKRWGYPGLFVAGLIPVPVLGAIGPGIYALERLHQPWYRFDNWYFGYLLLGGLIKMTVFVFLLSP